MMSEVIVMLGEFEDEVRGWISCLYVGAQRCARPFTDDRLFCCRLCFRFAGTGSHVEKIIPHAMLDI
jgi:hypothetical protein